MGLVQVGWYMGGSLVQVGWCRGWSGTGWLVHRWVWYRLVGTEVGLVQDGDIYTYLFSWKVKGSSVSVLNKVCGS